MANLIVEVHFYAGDKDIDRHMIYASGWAVVAISINKDFYVHSFP